MASGKKSGSQAMDVDDKDRGATGNDAKQVEIEEMEIEEVTYSYERKSSKYQTKVTAQTTSTTKKPKVNRCLFTDKRRERDDDDGGNNDDKKKRKILE